MLLLDILQTLLQVLQQVEIFADLVKQRLVLVGQISSLVPLGDVGVRDVGALGRGSANFDGFTVAQVLDHLLQAQDLVVDVDLVSFLVLQGRCLRLQLLQSALMIVQRDVRVVVAVHRLLVHLLDALRQIVQLVLELLAQLIGDLVENVEEALALVAAGRSIHLLEQLKLALKRCDTHGVVILDVFQITKILVTSLLIFIASDLFDEFVELVLGDEIGTEALLGRHPTKTLQHAAQNKNG